MTRDHLQVTITTPAGDRVDVDQGIAPLLLELWRRKIQTSFSCRGDARVPAYIAFGDLESADAFARLELPGWRRFTWGVGHVSGLASKGLRLAVYFPAGNVAKLTRALKRGQRAAALPRRVVATKTIADVDVNTGRRFRVLKGTPGRVADAIDHGDGFELLVAFKGAPHAVSVMLGERCRAA